MRQIIVTLGILAVGVVAGIVVASVIHRSAMTPSTTSANSSAKDSHGHDHDHGHGDGHGHDEGAGTDLMLSDQARQNLGLKIAPVTLSDFWRTIVVPGEISEQPGHSERRITTAVNGIVTKIYVTPGQTVRPNDALVDIQTTGELLANAQANLLKTIQDLELVQAELARLQPLADQGGIPGNRVLEKQYERQRLETQRLVQVQELLVRGLSPDQVKQIMESKVLLRSFTIRVPSEKDEQATPETSQAELNELLPASGQVESDPDLSKGDQIYTVETLNVFPGKLVQPADELCGLALHTNLRVVGMAFPKDAELINTVIEQQLPVTAIFESSAAIPVIRENLKIQYADNVVDPTSRLLRFYLPLKNEVVRDLANAEGVSFRAWRFKPGQRVQLRVPVEHWTKKIVLPVDAVVKEGAESYVFRENGRLLERVGVTVEYEDSRFAVIADDGHLFEGDPIAMNDAYQLNLALRKAQGSGVDLHAGHNH